MTFRSTLFVLLMSVVAIPAMAEETSCIIALPGGELSPCNITQAGDTFFVTVDEFASQLDSIEEKIDGLISNSRTVGRVRSTSRWADSDPCTSGTGWNSCN